MVSGWHNKLARLSQMSWDEIRTRVGQEVHKRREFVLYRVGVSPGEVRIGESPSRSPEFFFSRGGAQERAEMLRRHLPAEALEILHQANDICHHRFSLLGYYDLDYGAEIDWHLDRVHGKRAPHDPWFKIPFLDFAAVGDHKVTWELNRHQHLVTLAKAWLLSKDERYLREIIAQWRSWIKSNPYPLGINWGSSLEVAFRSLSWIWVDQMLDGTPAYAEMRADLLPALAFHGRYIERYLSTYFSPNTHLIGEAVALFFLGTLYPQITDATRWQHDGWKILLEEAQRQVRPDGVYFEQSLHYHVYALDFFLYARLLAARNGVDVPAEYDSTVGKMLSVVHALAQAGPPEGFGDDDGGRVFNPRRNRLEHLTDPLAIGTLLYSRECLSPTRLTEESIWLFGQKAIEALPVQDTRPEPVSSAFPDGGLYILSDSQPYAQQIVVDAGPQGVGRSGHGHADALSIRLTQDGHRLLVDAGNGVYISADPSDRNALRGTGAHNTMRVDGKDQAQPDGPFSWTAIPTTRVDNWHTGKTFSYFAGCHDGYTRLVDPVTHCRYIVKINGGPALVRDVALGQTEHDLEVLWHFAPDLQLRKTGANVLTISNNSSDEAEHPILNLIMPDQAMWQMEITRSLISPAYGLFQPAPLARAHARLRLPAEIASLLQTHSPGVSQDQNLVGMRHAAVQVYELVEGVANHGFYFALDKRPWSFGPWSSDAEFLYCRIEEEKLVHVVMVGGTSLAWQRQEILRAPGPCTFFEWRKRAPVFEPDEFSILPLFRDLTGGAALPPDTSSVPSTYAEKP